MKKLFWITLALLSHGGMAATPTVCVLDYLVDADPMSKSVVSTFQFDPQAKVIQEAKPMDFLDCIEQQFPQIVIVAHAFEIPSTTPGVKPDVKLGYFLRDGQAYQERIFFDQIFVVAGATLAAQKKTPQGIALKEIRIMVCDPLDIFKTYPSFNELIKSNGITLDEAPTSWFLSLFNPLPVTPFNEGWLAKSADCAGATEWKTDSNAYCKEDYWPGCDRSQADYCIPLKN